MDFRVKHNIVYLHMQLNGLKPDGLTFKNEEIKI